ncbi:hypothetical protein TNCV_2086971 [Trichonephila clavipes]|nr:hypothetical protein TNCV_2086971 [Trichonephila clavipes]
MFPRQSLALKSTARRVTRRPNGSDYASSVAFEDGSFPPLLREEKRKLPNSGRRPKASQPARGLLTTDHVILNHGQVTWMTPELAPLSPNYHTTPTGKRFNSQQI